MPSALVAHGGHVGRRGDNRVLASKTAMQRYFERSKSQRGMRSEHSPRHAT